MYFLTTGHSVHGKKFNLLHDIKKLHVGNELGDFFEVEEVLSSPRVFKEA